MSLYTQISYKLLLQAVLFYPHTPRITIFTANNTAHWVPREHTI